MKRTAQTAGLTGRKTNKRQKTKSDHNQIVVLKRDVRALKSANETHVFDQNIFGAFTATLISATWPSAGACLNCPIQGDTVANRQGAEVKAVGFRIKGNLLFNPGELQTTGCRLLVYLDKQNNGTANNTMLRSVSENGVLDNTTCVDVLYCPMNPVNKKRFKVLYDKTFNNNPAMVTSTVAGNTTGVSIRAQQFNIWIPWKGLTEYNSGNAANANDIQTNCVRVIAISQVPATAFNYMSISLASRFYFKEA